MQSLQRVCSIWVMHSFRLFPSATCLCLIKPKSLLMLVRTTEGSQLVFSWDVPGTPVTQPGCELGMSRVVHILAHTWCFGKAVLAWPLLFSQKPCATPRAGVWMSFWGNDEQKCFSKNVYGRKDLRVW